MYFAVIHKKVHLILRRIYRVVVIIGLPQARALPVDSMAGAGWREGGEGVLGAAGRQSIRGASWTVLSQGRPYNTDVNTQNFDENSVVWLLGPVLDWTCM